MRVKFKRNLFLVLALITMCTIPLFCSSCVLFLYSMMQEEEKAAERVKTTHSSVVFDFNNLWDMQFPDEFNSVFIFYQRGGWFGEGYFVAIYECEQPSEEFLKDFSEDMNDEVKEEMPNFNYYYENREQLEEKYNITITLDSEYLPDFEKEFVSVAYHKGAELYIGKDTCEEYCDDHLYMSYFPNTKTLYIFEDIT